MDKRYSMHGTLAGYKVGIIIIDTTHPLLPGNVQNATSFNFPVLYEIVKGINFSQLMSGDVACDAPIKEAIQKLESKGVSIILGSCGSFAHWQTRATEYAKVPLYLSIMAQVPFVLAGLPKSQKLGVLFANQDAYTDRVKSECHIESDERLIVFGANIIPSFYESFGENGTEQKVRTLEKEIVDLCVQKQKKHKEIGAWLFQCSELPVYSAAVQKATGLAVYDQTLLIECSYMALSRRQYGFVKGN